MDLLARQQPPSLAHWFGTDQMGRDLWLRAFQGTLTSLELGISTALCLQFASLGELIGGSLLAEKVFSYPGLGQATVDAGLRGDIPLLMGIVLFCTLLVFIGNAVARMLLARINRGWEGEHAV